MPDSAVVSPLVLPDWVTPYFPAFRELRRAVDLTTGFTLMPVEVTGADVAHALAKWLAHVGRFRVTTLAPTDDEAWRRIVADLFDVPELAHAANAAPASVVILIGEREPTPGVYAGLRLLNQRRDSLARHLACPLLWCGPKELMRLTWERAPDLWSVRALTTKLDAPAQLEDGASLAPDGPTSPLWPGVPVGDPADVLRERMEDALRQHGMRNAVTIGAMLAEALVARGELDEASLLVRRLERAATVLPASLILTKGVLLARRGDAQAAEAALASIEGTEVEAQRLVCLGNLTLAHDARGAKVRYEAAVPVARAALDRSTEAIALANLGVVAMRDVADPRGVQGVRGERELRDEDEAETRLDQALAILRDTGDAWNEARVLTKLASVHLSRHDSRIACELLEDALVSFREVADRAGRAGRLGEARTRVALARSYLEMGDPEKAKDDATAALAIAQELDDDDLANAAVDLLGALL